MGLIRLLLAISVVVVHSAQHQIWGFELVGGQAAVQAFYVISGFYMALVLNRKYPVGLDGYRTFILARLFRLYPAYGFVLALTVLLAATNLVTHPAYARWRAEAGRMSVPTFALYAGSQLTLIGQDAVWFTEYDEATGRARFAPSAQHDEAQRPGPQTENSTTTPAVRSDRTAVGVGSEVGTNALSDGGSRPGMDFLFVAQAWTLGVELLFYVVAPFIVRRPTAIGVLFVASWAIRLSLAHFGYRESPWSYRFFPSELAMFLMGSGGYHVYARFEPRAELMRRVGVVALPTMVGIIVFLFRFPVPLRALIVACATAASVPFVFALTKRNGVDRWIGELSYPVYITHELVRLALIHYRGSADVVTMVLITLFVSIALMLLVERPIEGWRARFIERRRLIEVPRADAGSVLS